MIGRKEFIRGTRGAATPHQGAGALGFVTTFLPSFTHSCPLSQMLEPSPIGQEHYYDREVGHVFEAHLVFNFHYERFIAIKHGMIGWGGLSFQAVVTLPFSYS